MIISLIGMSGSGKTFWSKKMAAFGFARFCCDDLIEEKLSSELKKLGYSGIADVSRWMGQPYDEQYADSSRSYLECEKEIVEWIISSIPKNRDVVIDTTGSVIYLNSRILQKLEQLTKVVYLKVPKVVEEEMFKLYLEDPKPVIWGKSFVKKSGERNIEALKRCYPELLKQRSKEYEKMTDIILDYFQLRQKEFGIGEFIKLIKQ